jgi:hypothetical protein
MNLVRDLHRHERKQYSQNGEDGVIERLFEIVGVTNRCYVELGTGSGEECNTRLLRERGWTGLMLDCAFEDEAIQLRREMITAENVNGLFSKYAVPDEFDLLSIDIDGNDYWVWKALAPHYRPRVAVIEYNGGVPAELPVVMPYDATYRWMGQLNCGQSLGALQKVSAAKGYALVYASPPNAFLVRRDLLPKRYRDVAPVKAQPIGWRIANRASHLRWERELRHLAWEYV